MPRNQPFSFSRLFRWMATLLTVLLSALLSHAGGPELVAGVPFFSPDVTGQPIIWPQGEVAYYTDQGDLSPILTNSLANALVARAFRRWASVSTAALAVHSAGQLAEDVNGNSFTIDSTGLITAPLDIAPSAIAFPAGIIYDYDGTLTDDLLGAGAGDASQCFWNAVYGGDDNWGRSANFLHALIVINGQCAQQPAQLPAVEYRLVRVVGRVLGLGWSQANLNVITGSCTLTREDFAGFPLMHNLDPIKCEPITVCNLSLYELSPDDRAAISQLYPVTKQDFAAFPERVIFSTTTAARCSHLS